MACAPQWPRGCADALRLSNNTPTWIFTTNFGGKWASYHRGDHFPQFCVFQRTITRAGARMQKCTPWPGQAYSLFAYVSKTSNLAWLDWIRSRESGAQRFVHASQNQCWGPCDYLIFSIIILPIVVRKGATDAPNTIADRTNHWTDVPRTYTNSVHETRCKQSHHLHESIRIFLV